MRPGVLVREGVIRCGWCLTGNCRNCAVVIVMGINHKGRSPKSNPYLWRCGCDHKSMNKPRLYPVTKCLDCQRRGVKVDRNWRCKNRKRCRQYRAKQGAFTPPTPRYLEEWNG